MKKGEKPPEMEAFERAFGREGKGVTNAGAGRDANAMWPSANQPAVKRQATPPTGIGIQGPSSSFPTRASGQVFPSAPGRPLGTSTALRSAQSFNRRDSAEGWNEEMEEDEADLSAEIEAEKASQRGQRASRSAPVVHDRFSAILVRVVLVLVALYSAYSLQSHSQRHYTYVPQQSASAPGSAVGITSLSYDAGWPLIYAHVALQQLPLNNLNPTPTRHDIQPTVLFVDVLFLAVPLWLLLEAVWLFWGIVLSRFGPRTPVRRFIAVGFTGLPATLWLVGALALGGYLSLTSKPAGVPSTWPKVVWLALAPAIPGFNLASAVSSVLAIPPNLWWQDFGVFLLVMALPITLLTACLYVFFCLIGRGLRRSSGRRA
jgi:hypothetical protein